MDDDSGLADILQIRKYMLDELIKTERDYVRDLDIVVNTYMPEVLKDDPDKSVHLKDGKDKLIFGNIQAIFEWHRDKFLVAVEKCQESPMDIAQSVKLNKIKLRMYIVYCRNKPFSEHIVHLNACYFETLRQKLGQGLSLADLLIKPIQRLTKYELLFNQIIDQSRKAGEMYEKQANELEKALNIMTDVLQSANKMMEASRIQDFDGNLGVQGKLHLIDTMLCEDMVPGSRNSTFTKKLRVFLFDQIVIFAEIMGKSNPSNPFAPQNFAYKSHILVNKMQLIELDVERKFAIKSTDPSRLEVGFICEAETDEIYNNWIKTIKDMKNKQSEFLMSLVNPLE